VARRERRGGKRRTGGKVYLLKNYVYKDNRYVVGGSGKRGRIWR
jgi:hypothetical protein